MGKNILLLLNVDESCNKVEHVVKFMNKKSCKMFNINCYIKMTKRCIVTIKVLKYCNLIKSMYIIWTNFDYCSTLNQLNNILYNNCAYFCYHLFES